MNPQSSAVRSQLARRYRQIRRLWVAEGAHGVSDRVRRFAAEWLAPQQGILPVRSADVMAADLSSRPEHRVPAIVPGERLTANWVTTPPSPGSGGHTTLFRIINYLEAHGYQNRVYFYDVYGGDHAYYEQFVHAYYGFQGSVQRVEDGMEDAHMVVATGWPTAYPVFNARCSGKRFYFVQDYEPHFHPVGAVSLFAENTYRMGFYAITAGKWLSEMLRTEFALEADSFDFGCDTSAYHPLQGIKRNGVVFYARPEAARRGFELGVMALKVFASRHPEIDIHIYGQQVGQIFPRCIDHGKATPEKLNRIYNQCYAGLSLSLTNVSLVPHEMLAAGCIPVVNEAAQNRIVLDNSYVRYARPYPQALALALEEVLNMADFEQVSEQAARSVHSTTWDEAGATVDAIFRRALGTAARF